MKPKFYVTTAIPYVNAKPHLGHSYEMVATDVIARYKRMAGFDVWFLTGADMNSLNTERKARELGRDVREYVEEMADAMVQTWKALRISNDDFIRTTEPRHRRAAQECFRRAYENGDIYEATYEGFYCYSCEAYYDPDDLLEGNRCPVHQSPCEWLAERNYFFRLSRYEAALRKHIEEHPEFIYPESRRNEVLAFLDRGLKDFSVSRRSARWGIPTPTDPNQVIYVWFDALVNYLTGAGFPDHPEAFQKWWPCDVHVIGKDIWRFHCIYWPAMLMSAGIELPKKVAIHGFVTLGGEKMSKSRGIYVDPVAAVREYGADAIRYYLVREVPFETDGDFTWEAFVARYNADLANDLGNLLNRTLNLVRRHFGGKTPPIGEPTAEDVALAKAVLRAREEYCRLMEGFSLHLATDQAMGIVREANRYLADTEPWRLLRDERRDRAGTVLYHAMEALRWAATLLTPVMPDACQQIRAQLGIPEETPDLTRLEWGGLRPGNPIGEVRPLFPRLQVQEEPQAADSSAPTKKEKTAVSAEAPSSEWITYEEFSRVDLRVAEVVAAERIPNADRLLKLTVRVGEEERTIVAGIAQHYAPEQMVGKRIIIVANLKPRKVFGVESQGMLLAAQEGERLALVELPEPIASGAKVS